MLTPGKIKEYRFQPAGQGVYRADDVDRFFAAVSDDYEKIYNEHGEMLKRMKLLVEKVKEYEEQENLIKKTLLVAQKKADEIENNAKTHSDDTVTKAEKQAAEKTAHAEKRARELMAAANERAQKISTESEQRARDILAGASATSEKTMATAKQRATALLTEAKQRAEKVVGDARAQASAILDPLKDQVAAEKKALEEVRAQSKDFKKKLTESYYQQIGMTSELLNFVEGEDQPVKQAVAAAAAAPKAVVEEPVTLPEEDLSFLDSVDTYTPSEDDLFTSIMEETVTDESATGEFFLTSEPEEAVKEEAPAEAVVEETPAEEAPAEEPEVESGFSFVGGFGSSFADFGAQSSFDELEKEIPEVPLAGIDEIFNTALAAEREKAEAVEPEMPAFAEPAEPEEAPVEPEMPTGPFGELNRKYRSVAPAEEPDDVFDPIPGLNLNKVEEPTRQISLPETPAVEEPEEEPAYEDKKSNKPEKKKRRLSLFSMYEDDDDEDDEDEDDEEDEDEDDEEEGGFKGFFRK